jgi:large subunit ribosomal protein L15
MRLHDLKPRPGAKHRRKRLGQGESSGHGKTSGRGGKGQTARSGSSIRIGFEGGQMPLIRRMPKRGFNNSNFAIRFVPVNLEALNRFDDGATVDEKALRDTGLAKGGKRIKILGDGELKKKLTILAHSFSASARAKIEKLGGVCQVLHIGPVKPEPVKPVKKAKAAPAKETPTEGEPAKAKPAKGESKKAPGTKPENAKAQSAKPAPAKETPAKSDAPKAASAAASAPVSVAEPPAAPSPQHSTTPAAPAPPAPPQAPPTA